MNTTDKTAVALGSFDGLHKGHMSVIACALFKKELGLIPLVLLFDTHPLLTLTGKSPPEILQKEKRDIILSSLGIKTEILSFADIKEMTCREFFEKILIGNLNALHALILSSQLFHCHLAMGLLALLLSF